MLPRISSGSSLSFLNVPHASSPSSRLSTYAPRRSPMECAQLRSAARSAAKDSGASFPRVVSVPALTALAASLPSAPYLHGDNDAGLMACRTSCSGPHGPDSSTSSTVASSSPDSSMSCTPPSSNSSPPSEPANFEPPTTAPHIIYRRCMDEGALKALAATPAAQQCMLAEGSAVSLNEYFGVLPFADVITADAQIADAYAFDEADVGVAHIVVHLQRQDVDHPWAVIGTTGSYGKLALNQLISECSSLLSQWLHTATSVSSVYAAV